MLARRAAQGVLLTLTILLVGAALAPAHAQTRREERAKAAKMAKIDAEIEDRRAKAPIPDEGVRDMNGVDLRKKRQLEILQARLGNTTLGVSQQDNQEENVAARGFTVRKFKGNAAQREREQKGYAPPARGIDPPGKPLAAHKKKRLLFF